MVHVAIDEQFEYNDTAHKLIQSQIDRLGVVRICIPCGYSWDNESSSFGSRITGK